MHNTLFESPKNLFYIRSTLITKGFLICSGLDGRRIEVSMYFCTSSLFEREQPVSKSYVDKMCLNHLLWHFPRP